MIEAAIEYERPVRIGVNWGSLDQALLTRMMDENNKLAGAAGCEDGHAAGDRGERAESAAAAEYYGLPRDRIILSAKVSAACRI